MQLIDITYCTKNPSLEQGVGKDLNMSEYEIIMLILAILTLLKK